MTSPAFDTVLEGFRQFAAASNAPTSVRFIERDDIIITGKFASIRPGPAEVREKSAREAYDLAVLAGHGVAIIGVAATRHELYALVYRPSSREDAIERQIPPSAKFSLRAPLLVAQIAGPIIWWFLRRRARKDAWLEEWKRDTFGDTPHN